LFPNWNTTTGPVAARIAPVAAERDAMMPTRRRTRAAVRASRITGERALNDALVAERNRPPPF